MRAAGNFFCRRTILSDLELQQKVARQGPWRATPGGMLARCPTRALERLNGGRPPTTLGVERAQDHHLGLVQMTVPGRAIQRQGYRGTSRAHVIAAQVRSIS